MTHRHSNIHPHSHTDRSSSSTNCFFSLCASKLATAEVSQIVAKLLPRTQPSKPRNLDGNRHAAKWPRAQAHIYPLNSQEAPSWKKRREKMDRQLPHPANDSRPNIPFITHTRPCL